MRNNLFDFLACVLIVGGIFFAVNYCVNQQITDYIVKENLLKDSDRCFKLVELKHQHCVELLKEEENK